MTTAARGHLVRDDPSRDRICAYDLVKSAEDGRTDWKTLANIITANLLGEVVCASFADFKHGKRTKDFKPDIEWKFSYEENGVLVFAKQHSPDQRALSFMGRSVLDFPVRPIASVLRNLESFHLWNKFMTDCRLVQLISESENHQDFIAYFLHETKRCLVRTKRDMVLFVHNQYRIDRFVQAAISVEHPECPVNHDITRAECCLGSGWVVEPYEGQRSKSIVSFVCNVDMKAMIPPLVLNRLLQRQPLAIHYMRQCVAEEVKKHKPLNPARFFLKTSAESPTESKTDHQRGLSREEAEDQHRVGEGDCLTSTELAAAATGNGLGSFVFTSTSKQYEDPVGISEFIGYNTAPRIKRKQRRRLRCCQSVVEPQEEGGGGGGKGGGGNNMDFFSSGSCEECRARASSADAAMVVSGGERGRHNINYINR